MNSCSELEYRRFVEQISGLCCEGFVSEEHCRLFGIDFAASRETLLGAYQEFLICCEWLDGCRFNDYATHFSPDSIKVKAKIEATCGQSINNGSLIAAVMYLELPYVTLTNTPNIFVAISRFCTRFHSTVSHSS